MKPDKKTVNTPDESMSASERPDTAPPKRKLPLMVHLSIGFLGFSAMLLVVLWLFQTVFLEQFYKSVKTGQVKSCAYSIADNIDSDELTDLITEIEEQNTMFVTIYNTDDTRFGCVYSSTSQPGFQSDIAQDTVAAIYHQAQSNGGEHSSITHIKRSERFFKPDWDKTQNTAVNNGGMQADPGNNGSAFDPNGATLDQQQKNTTKHEPAFEKMTSENLAYAKIVSSSSGERLVIVESAITPVASVVDTLRYQLIIMTVVIVILSIIMAIAVARLISKPITDATENAKSLARQDYDVNFSGGRYKEITELNDTLNFAASELKKVDSLQKELIANISHDLRTPLTMITGYSEVMRDLPGEMTPENIQIIIDEATRLNSLVTDLLDLSRLQSGTADIKSAPFSLTECIKGIFGRYTKLKESDGLNIVFEHTEEVFIMGDELRMTQVLYNLINNAINYIGSDNTVIVRQTVEGEKVRVEVIDHGEGIPADKLDYIWDRYYRVDKEHRRAKIGTGLGLSIVKGVLLAHNAEFGVESTPGEGSDFWFVLPIIPTDND